MNCRICGRNFVDKHGAKRQRCNSCNTKVRRIRTKLKAIALLGGKCCDCGFDKHPAPMQFHHLDESTKKFEIGMVANKAWSAIESEIRKCMLLCANCHAIRHSSRYNDNIIQETQGLKVRPCVIGSSPI